MSIGNAVLNLLGLAPQFQEAEMIISASQTAVNAIKVVANLFETDDGKKAKEDLIAIMTGSSQKEDGSIHLDTARKPKAVPAAGHWEWDWDAMKGYVNPHWVEDAK